MDKFEVDAFQKAQAEKRPMDDGGLPIDSLPVPAEERDSAGLPAVPFQPVKDNGPVAGPADLPVPAFEPAREPAAPAAAAAPPPELKTPPTPGGEFSPGEWIPPQTPEPPAAAEPAETPTDPDALRTRLARKFVTLADSFTESFGPFTMGAGNWSVELTAPQGMSTGGGKQALQHIRLIPKRQGFSVIVAGTVNQVERRAELRDFDHVSITHEVRFRHSLEISPAEWIEFLKKAEGVLNASGIQSMRTPPPRDLLEQRRSMMRVSKGAIVALVVVLILASLVVWRVIVALGAKPTLE